MHTMYIYVRQACWSAIYPNTWMKWFKSIYLCQFDMFSYSSTILIKIDDRLSSFHVNFSSVYAFSFSICIVLAFVLFYLFSIIFDGYCFPSLFFSSSIHFLSDRIITSKSTKRIYTNDDSLIYIKLFVSSLFRWQKKKNSQSQRNIHNNQSIH